MMKKQKPADFRIERQRNRAGNRTVSPSNVTVVLSVGVLRVENQNIAAAKKLDEGDSLLCRSLFRLFRTHAVGPCCMQKWIGLMVRWERDVAGAGSWAII